VLRDKKCTVHRILVGMPGREGEGGGSRFHLADHLKGKRGDNIEKKVLR